MERLTRRMCGGYGMVEGHELSTLHGRREAVDRLAAYEDTGMEPNEIKLLQAANGIQAVAMREMAHIYAAEKDGRLVVLPFKVGEKVWLTSAFFQDFEKPVPAMVQKVEWNGENSLVPCQIFIWADIGSGLRAYGFSAESIGHNFFLTYEEAEAALLRKDNGI